MAIMDIADIRPLLSAVHDLLADHGIFVFATQHPCFATRDDKYITAHSYEGEAITGSLLSNCISSFSAGYFQCLLRYRICDRWPCRNSLEKQ